MALISTNNPKFIYIHIFKCGGNSIRKALEGFNTQEIQGVHADLGGIHFHYIQKMKNEAFYKEAFKFTFVRNPFDWMVSTYEYIKHSPAHGMHQYAASMSFAQWMEWYVNNPMQEKRELSRNKCLTLSGFTRNYYGVRDMDFIGRHENLAADFPILCKKLGMPITQLPHINKNINRQTDYQSYYDTPTKSLVEKVFKEDLEEFSYEF